MEAISFRRNGSLYWVGTDHLGGTVAVAGSSFGGLLSFHLAFAYPEVYAGAASVSGAFLTFSQSSRPL